MEEIPMVLEQTLNEQQITDFRQAFASVDFDVCGIIRCKDIPKLFARLDETYQAYIVEGEELLKFLEQMDLNLSSSISFEQFLTLIAFKINTTITVEELVEAFRIFDRRDTGFISFDDLWRVMQNIGENLSRNDIEEMMREADQDGDGRINFAEFVEIMRLQEQQEKNEQ